MIWRSLRAGGWIHAIEFDHESKVYNIEGGGGQLMSALKKKLEPNVGPNTCQKWH